MKEANAKDDLNQTGVGCDRGVRIIYMLARCQGFDRRGMQRRTQKGVSDGLNLGQ